MDFLKAQLTRIQQQLNGLSASQKMLSGTLVAIMVLTLLYWSRYASDPEMVPVSAQSFAPDQITPITAQLEAKGIRYRVTGGSILVPADRKFEVFADLYYQQLISADIKNGFDELMKSSSLLESPQQQQARANRAREITLGQIIARFPNVATAQVMIDPNAERRIGVSIQPSATVYLSMRSGHKPDKRLVHGAADLVAGAQAGMPRDRVAVNVDGVSYPVRSEDNLGAMTDDIIQRTQEHERRYVNKIQDMLAFIPRGVLVSVTVKLDTVSQQKEETTYDAKGTVAKPISEDTSSEENRSASSAGEPGAVSNMGGANQGLAVEGASGETTGGTRERSNVRYDVRVPSAKTISHIPAGNATVEAAAVRIPLSYFATVYKKRNPSISTEPGDDVLRPLISDEVPKIRDQVMACTGLRDEKAAKVETYVDLMPVVDVAPAPASSPMNIALSAHAREIAVGGLAMFSLLLVTMMVRKAAPAPVIATRPEPVEPQTLRAGEDLAGEAGAGNPLLDGMELDEDAIKAQQMLTQVQTLVNDNPDAAANLVKRWLNRP